MVLVVPSLSAHCLLAALDGLPFVREITGKVYWGHLFACLLLDRHPIFYVHGELPSSAPSCIASL